MFESMGLASDKQSFENAALLLQLLNLPFEKGLVPLLVDPTGQALKWYINYCTGSAKAFDVVQQNDKKFTYSLELAVRFGKIFIITNLFAVSSSLFSVLLGQIWKNGDKKLVNISGKYVELHENFKLVLITTLDNFFVTGELAAHITTIKFTITTFGFTDQLISKWVSIKKADWEFKKVSLMNDECKLNQAKNQLQDQLLDELFSSQGNILENQVNYKSRVLRVKSLSFLFFPV